MSVYGSNAPYDGAIIGTNIAFEQNNDFYDNTYLGPWYFWPWEQSNTAYPVSFDDWRDPVTDKCLLPGQIASGTCNSGFGQDGGSSYTLDFTPGNEAPTVSVTAPANGATVSGTISLTAAASDDISVSGVRFKVNGVNHNAEDLSVPYSTSLDTTTLNNGSHTISATSRDAEGLNTTATVTVTVSNGKTGDINGDNAVNVLDLSVLLSNWSRTSATWTNQKCDLSIDGTVTILDLSVLLTNWGT
jgi:hypothetical protein